MMPSIGKACYFKYYIINCTAVIDINFYARIGYTYTHMSAHLRELKDLVGYRVLKKFLVKAIVKL